MKRLPPFPVPDRSRFVRTLLAAAFAAAMCYISITLFRYPRNIFMFPTLWFTLASSLFVLAVYVLPTSDGAKFRRASVAFFGFAILTISPFAFTQAAFGTHDVNSILITANENRLGEMATIGLGSFPDKVASHLVAFVVVLVAAAFLARRVRHFVPSLAVFSAALLMLSPATHHLYASVAPNPAYGLVDPVRDVVPPEITARPAQKKNLIIVYLESVERTYRDIPATAEAFAPLARIEDAGLAATDMGQLFGTSFTVGGQVASQCGVPLYPRGVFHVRSKNLNSADRQVDFAEFMTGIDCLGDLLTADGYVGSYMNGSSLELFSKGELFAAHGYSRLFGLESHPGWETEPRRNMWGLNDEVLFGAAEAELAVLAETGRPFVLSMLTLSTHGPGALLDQSCTYPVGEDSDLPAAIHCTGNHVAHLIGEVERLGLSDNTIIAVMSDHLAMKNDLHDEISAFGEAGGVRRNFFTLIGAGKTGRIDRHATTVDIYPTLLEAMGYKLKDGRANLGVSLLSDRPTMTELLTLDTLNAALDGNVEMQEYLWQSDEVQDSHIIARAD